MDNATSRKEVEITVDNAVYVIKHYYYTLLNDNVARRKWFLMAQGNRCSLALQLEMENH